MIRFTRPLPHWPWPLLLLLLIICIGTVGCSRPSNHKVQSWPALATDNPNQIRTLFATNSLVKTNYCTVINKSLSLSTSSDSNKVVASKSLYGEDSRLDYCQFRQNQIIKRSALATVMLVAANQIYPYDNSNELFHIRSQQYESFYAQEGKRLCPEVRFKDFELRGFCSGVLLESGHMITAGHCLREKNIQRIRAVVTIPANEQIYLANTYVRNQNQVEQIYHADQILEFSEREEDLFMGEELDIAVIKFKESELHKFEAIAPLAAHLSHPATPIVPAAGLEVVMTGHPMGLNMISNFGSIRQVDPNGFFSNNDSFQGNSGSPVFTLNTSPGQLIGILVSGQSDLEFDPKRGCHREARFANEKGAERILRTDRIPLDTIY